MDDADPTEPAPAPKPVLQYSAGGDHPSVDRDRGWVHVWTAQNPFEANLAVAKLQEAGLNARVDMENAAQIGSWAGSGPTGTSVHAMRADAEAARAMLVEIDARRERRQNAGAVKCPACGHRPGKRAFGPVRWAGLITFLASPIPICLGLGDALPGDLGLFALWVVPVAGMALMVVPMTPRWQCPACGNRWAEPEPPAVDDDDDDEP